MKTYTRCMNKMDVIRGRSVPTPPFKTRRDRAQVLESLNPYQANRNVRLVLDLVALKHGLGLALKCLSNLEMDVQNNLRPHQLRSAVDETSEAAAGGRGGGLTVRWKQPLALLYAMPVPRDLSLHFAVEISFPDDFFADNIMQMIGYDETRYVQQVWHSSQSCAVDFKGQDTMSYEATFPNVPLDDDTQIVIDVWTCVDGQLVAKSTTYWTQPNRRVPPAWHESEACFSRAHCER